MRSKSNSLIPRRRDDTTAGQILARAWSGLKLPCLSVAMILGAGTAISQVALTTQDGSVSISGELVSFENNQYTLRTILGELIIDGATVTCTGEDCPQATYAMGETISLAGSAVLSGTYLYNILDEYSLDIEANLLTETAADGSVRYRLENETDELILAVDVASMEPDAAFDALRGGQANMILTSRRASNSEIEAFIDAGLGDITADDAETIVAQDGLVVVVSRDNPVRNLTIEQLDAIFSGGVRNWSQLGGDNSDIELVLPPAASAVSSAFYTAVLEPNFSDYASGATRAGNVADIAKLVSANPAAIGVTSSAVLGDSKALQVRSGCGMVAEPAEFSIKSEDYPMSRRHYAYTKPGQSTVHMDNIVALMLQRPQAARGAGLVALDTVSSDLNDAGKRLGFALVDPAQTGELNNLRSFVGQVLDAQRLSTTFRFGSGSSQLDNKARADAIRLAQLLQEPQFSGREVLLIGFTDSIGRSDVNLLLSQRRAQQVLDELAASGVTISDEKKVEVLGFGASSPIACNTEGQGRELNRRVEVWLR